MKSGYGLAVFSVCAALAAAAGTSVAQAAETMTVDGTHSSVVFRVKHNGIAYFYGRFNNPNGSFSLDENDPGNSMVDVTVATESVDSGNGNRDRHLKSPDFFNAKQFPEIRFKSTKVEKAGDDKFSVTGDLSLHGVTKSITITLEKTGTAVSPRSGKTLMGVAAEFTIKRSDFGMDYGLDNGALGDEVKLMISLEGVAT